MDEAGEVLETVRIDNSPVELAGRLANVGEAPQVALEATYGWCWAADVLQDMGAEVHLAHPLGMKKFTMTGSRTTARTPPIWLSCCA